MTSLGNRAVGYYYDFNDDDYYRIDSFTIYGVKDSAAEKYANDNGLSFVEVGVTEQPTIEPSKIDISDWTVKGIKNVAYTGKVIRPDLDVVNGDGEHADFTVKFKNNKNAGTATVTITGTGNYKGTIVTTFNIAKAKQPMTVNVVTKKVSRSKLKKANVKVKPLTVKKAQGAVSCKKLSGPNYLTVSNNGVVTVKKGWFFSGTVMKVKVKVTAKGNSNYKSSSKTVTVRIKIK